MHIFLHSRFYNSVYIKVSFRNDKIVQKNECFDIYLETSHRNLTFSENRYPYKAANGLSPVIMSQVFPLKENIRYPSENRFITRNVKSVRYGTETLAHLGPKIWSIIPNDIKEEQSLKLFTKKIKQWKPERCPCKLCKTYVEGLEYIN